ncbi:MAG TPA: tetratricopeptide repeat protein [Pyrinomonadaceae bacterium]|jgi:tetratricopeptide (TPR) repeat protein|nr:tetratricopeptide repeat protein [Pyrinomonadaceae bacterium]
MRASIFRSVLTFIALLGSFTLAGVCVMAQDVGVDVGGGAGVFRAKNPETKKRTPRTTPVGGAHRLPRATANPPVEERVEDLLEKGNQFRDSRRFAEAEEAYNSVLKIKPRDGRAAYGLGNIYSDQQRWEEAEAAYRNAAAWSPSDVDALVALSVVLVQPRSGADNAKRLAEAESFSRRAVQLQPKNAVAWDRLGVALQSRGLFNNETESAYRRAVELDPEFAVAYAHLARVLKHNGKTSEAVPLFEKASQLAKDPPTLNLIAESLQAEQQWQDSEPVLKRVLELDARNPTGLYLLGRMLVVFKRYQESEPYLKLATEVSPRAFQPFHLLGRTYLALDRFEDAEVTYERAATVASPGDRKQLAGIYGFEGVGDGFMKMKKKPSAARAYRRALELDPGNKDLEQKLSRAS